MKTYRYREPHVTAVFFKEGKPKAVRDFLGDRLISYAGDPRRPGRVLEVKDGNRVAFYCCYLEKGAGSKKVYPGEWMVSYVDGRLEPMSPEEFAATFEEV